MGAVALAGTETRVHRVTTLDAALDALTFLDNSPWVGFDTETRRVGEGTERYRPGLDPYLSKVRLMQIGTSTDAFVLDCTKVDPTPWLWWLKDHSKRLVAQNGRFDLAQLQQAGVFIPRVWDTYIADRLIRPDERGGSSLEALAERYLHLSLDKGLQSSDWGQELTDAQWEYAGRDVTVLPRLRGILDERVKRLGMLSVARLEFEAVPGFAMLARSGFVLDKERWRRLWDQAEADLEDVERKLLDVLPSGPRQGVLFGNVVAGVNLSSPEQVRAALGRLGLEVESTDEHHLKALDHPVGEMLLRHRELATRLKMFYRPMFDYVHPVTGRVHAEYWQMAAASGRTASSDPNMQQIPREEEVRGCFGVAPGSVLVVADYSQIELRIVAEQSEDPRMIEAFRSGADIHRQTAALVTGKAPGDVTKAERQMAKACFSGDTEILTTAGWVRFDRYDGHTPVAQYVLPVGLQYNPPRGRANRWGKSVQEVRWDGSNGRIEFVPPIAFRRFRNQEVWHQEDRNIDLLVTPNHDIVYLDNNMRPRKTAAAQVSGGNCRYVVAAGQVQYGSTLGETTTRVLAMVAADGSFFRKSIRLGFSKERKIARCRSLLRAVGVDWQEAEAHGVVTFFVHDQVLRQTLLQYVSERKDLNWRCLAEVDGRLYLDEAAFWDSHRLASSGRERVRFTSVRRTTVDVMQAMAALNGIPSVLYAKPSRGARKSPTFDLSYRLADLPRWRVSWNPAEGVAVMDVWCVQVPSGAIVIRRNGKVCVAGNCNFGLCYGMGAAGLVAYAHDAYGVDMTQSDADLFRKRYFDTYKGVATWHHRQLWRAKKYGGVRTLAGRWRPLPEPGVTKATNSPTQGTGADILKAAMGLEGLASVAFARGWNLVSEVHDEISLEVPAGEAEEAQAVLTKTMVAAGERYLRKVPVEAEAHIGKSWADK